MLPKLNLLVIEDNQYDAEIVEDCLRQMDGTNCSLVFSESISDSRNYFSSESPDLVLLDLDLPDSSGLETLNYIAEMGPKVPIVVLTDNVDPEIGIKAIKRGAQDLVHKSELNFPLLKKSIMHAIERKRMLVELELMQQHAYELAMLDSLTGLPNRLSMMNSLQAFVSHAKRTREKFAVLFVDLDNFKPINDVMGHQVGDLVLKGIADRLRNALRESDVVARIGGDEFICILHDYKNVEGISSIADKLNRLVQLPIEFNGQNLQVGCSIGVAIYPDNGKTADELISLADKAMYDSKKRGRNQFRYAGGESVRRPQLPETRENQIRGAIEKHEMCLHYQPIINIRTQRIEHCEALLRWNHPSCGLLLPDKFICESEQTNLIADIDEYVMREAAVYSKILNSERLPNVKVHVNVSAEHMSHPDSIDQLVSMLEEVSVSGNSLNFEIPESLLSDRTKNIRNSLERLNGLGVTISINDFGSNWSSMQHLYDFPIAMLKIDRSLIHDIGTNRRDLAIVTALISLARSLDIELVAEGVETRRHVELLQQMGCANLQGYYFTKPLPPDKFKDFLLQYSAKQKQELIKIAGSTRH